MAGEDRTETDRLIQRLRERPFEFDFFQGVRRVECAGAEKPRTGRSRRLGDDHVRFSQEPSLAFAPSTVSECSPSADPDAPRLFINFMGLLGPNGPLPLHLTEYARDRERNHNDPTLARFLDVFNHRHVSLFYRAHAETCKTISYDRPDDDDFSRYVGSLFGLGFESLLGRDSVPDRAKLFFSGHLCCPTRHASGLQGLLADYFGMPAEITEFVGQWLDLPPDSQCRLGADPAAGTLGSTAIVGSRIWDCQQKFRIRFGPMGLDEYQRMLPGGSSQSRLAAWIRNYVGEELTFDVQLVLRAEEVPMTRLGQAGRLGWSTWLQTDTPEQDADQLILLPQ